MDIVYIVGKNGKRDNFELRMSLRSIAKYGLNIGKVIVAGFPPRWLSNEVLTVSIPDKFSYKHKNILNCIERIVDKKLVVGDFLYSSDDHFYVKETDFDNYPYYLKGELRRSVNKTDPHYHYHRSLYDTRLLCEKYGLPTLNYSQHCNTHMHTEAIRVGSDIIQESYNLLYGVEPTSIIMNVWQTFTNPPSTQKRDDLKITIANNKDEIYTQIGSRESFSIGDNIWTSPGIKDFFNAEFDIPSIFEKN